LAVGLDCSGSLGREINGEIAVSVPFGLQGIFEEGRGRAQDRGVDVDGIFARQYGHEFARETIIVS
jgi:hypothetical protein